jgi:hypothetical protein
MSRAAPDPDPFAGEGLPFSGEQQAYDNAEPKDRHGVFVFKANSCQEAEPQPQLLIFGL